MYSMKGGPKRSWRRYSRVTGREMALKSGSAATFRGSRDGGRRRGRGWEIGAVLQHPARALGAQDLAGRAKTRGAARQIGEPVDERRPGELRLDRGLEDIPKAQVEEVEFAAGEQGAGEFALLGDLQAEPLGRQPQAELEIGAGLGANAPDDLPDDPGRFSAEPPQRSVRRLVSPLRKAQRM